MLYISTAAILATLQDDHFVPIQTKHYIDIRPTHACSTKKAVSLDCIDEYGEINVYDNTCTCSYYAQCLQLRVI